MATNYDKIANVYDFIRKIVFGNSIVTAQVCLLKYIPADSHVLIVGGGTGWIIEEITKIYAKGLVIDYVESSAKMIKLSEKRNAAANQVNFIQQPIEDYVAGEKYDVILTPFLFDNFSIDKIQIIVAKLDSYLKENGLLLYTDFVLDENNARWWQKILLKIMYLFFRITCNIETQQVINMDNFFDLLYYKVFEASYYNNFIISTAYRKK
jgi:ubiquinone/menaquinone biosynthesis C-methylase UbiE